VTWPVSIQIVREASKYCSAGTRDRGFEPRVVSNDLEGSGLDIRYL
jgi:hypothetical protein